MTEHWYIAGPMRGIPLYNFPAFDAADKLLLGLGHWPCNPADLDRKIGVDEFTDPLPDGFMEEALARDLHEITREWTTGVALLPGWERSAGAREELHVARLCGKQVAYIDPVTAYFGPEPHRDIVGVCGHALAGKDTAARGLVKLGWRRIGFSDAIMSVAKRVGWSGEKDQKGRQFLIDLGLGVREHVAGDAWIQAIEQAVDVDDRHVVITGVRYPEEADWIRSRGGYLVRVDRALASSPVSDADTEQHLEELHPEHVIVNDGIDHVQRRLCELAARPWRGPCTSTS